MKASQKILELNSLKHSYVLDLQRSVNNEDWLAVENSSSKIRSVEAQIEFYVDAFKPDDDVEEKINQLEAAFSKHFSNFPQMGDMKLGPSTVKQFCDDCSCGKAEGCGS